MSLKNLLVVFVLFIGEKPLQAQDTLRVVNWNLEYFGDRVQNPPRQVSKVIELMQHINADVYALVEIVNKDSLQRVKNALGNDYTFVISPYGSIAPDTNSPYYSSAQKLALLYRKSKVKVLRSRGYMASSASAYYNFASGRVPFLVETEIKTTNNQWQRLDFYVVHAKAMSDNQSCMRRTAAALEWKDSLDAFQNSTPFILLGDFNDDFDYSICGGNSNYLNFLSDSTGSHYYFSPTLAPSLLGINSINGFSGFIDHVLVSDEVKPWYVRGSVKLMETEVESWVSSYNEDVSDHFPVTTSYAIPSPNSLTDPSTTLFSISPNPASSLLQIHAPYSFVYSIYNLQGMAVVNGQAQQGTTTLSVTSLPEGTYIVHLYTSDGAHLLRKLNVLH